MDIKIKSSFAYFLITISNLLQDVEGNKVTIQRSLAAMKIAFKAEQQR